MLEYDYTFWLERFKRILVAHREYNTLISDDMLQSLQLFLLDTGQFNASFTEQELKKMNYPRTPFAVTEEHAYLRATDTWATQLISNAYQEKIGKQKVFPIWIDSEFFWKELTRYCRVINIHDVNDSFIMTIASELIAHDNNSFWIEIDLNDYEQLSKSIKKEIKKAVLKLIAHKKNIPKSLISIFEDVWVCSKNKISEESKTNLKDFFTSAKYIHEIQDWCAKEVKPFLAKLDENLIFFCKDNFKSFENMDAIVFFDESHLYNDGCKLINSLGYRIDPTRATRILLTNRYKKLFVEADITEKFWEEFKLIKLISKVSDEERKHIETVQGQVIEQLKSYQEKINKTVDLKQELTKLNASRSQINHSMFHIYKKYIVNYIETRYLEIDDKSIIRIVADPEIKMALCLFLEANETGNLPMMVRATQIIAEVMQLDLMVNPLEKNFVDLVKNEYLKKYPVQHISLTPFAMRAFVRILQTSCLDQNDTVNMAITNQSYYELLENFERLDPQKRKVTLTRHVEEIPENIDMIFMEIHPNNVIETKQFAHNPNLLVAKLTKFPRKKRTLILDVTLNALDDKEISSFLDCSSSLIHSGDLSVVLIQSLTKFAQLGLDKKSAGCLITINNNCVWRKTNQRLFDIDSGEKTDDSTKQFFSYFLHAHKNLLNVYITKINENVQYVYRKVVESINFLEVQNRKRFQVTTSSDKQACYVALNMNGLFPEMYEDFTFTDANMQDFGKDVLIYLFHPLCDFFQLTVTERASVGFPLSNINLVYGSLRFTIGLESKPQLNQYAEILSYISFVINRPNDVNLFLGYDLVLMSEDIKMKNKLAQKGKLYLASDGAYVSRFNDSVVHTGSVLHGDFSDNPIDLASLKSKILDLNFKNKILNVTSKRGHTQDLRIKYFQEKVSQFKAMTPGKGHKYIISFEDSGTYKDRLGIEHQLQRKAVMLNGDLILCIEKSQQNGSIFVNYLADKIFISSSAFGDISFLDQRAPAYLKRMAAACLTECAKSKEQNIFTIDGNYILFSSFEILGPWSKGVMYGPFQCANDNGSNFLFHFYHKDMRVYINNKLSDVQVLIQQGNIVIPLMDMSIDEIEKVVFSNIDYKISDAITTSYEDWPILRSYNIKNHKPVFHYLEVEGKSQLIMQLDEVLLCNAGVTVYRRFFDERKTIVEIDFWGTKDPILARFMRLVAAAYVKEENNINFVSMDNNYSRFLFKDSYDNINQLFNRAIKLVLDNKEELYKLLLKFKKQEGSNYSFMASDAMFSWPNTDNISSVKAKKLIDETLNVLKSRPINNADTLRSTMGFQFSNAIRNNKEAIAFAAVAVCTAGGCYYKLKM